jgi:TRAP-type C4-dicarboxylate transport system substrate-binding protein
MKMTSIRPIAVLSLAATIAIATWTSASFAQTFDLKIGFASINGPQHGSSRYFKNEIEKRTNGRFKVRLFPAAQLGKVPRQIEGIQLGTQEAFHTPPGFFVGINTAFQVLDAPGLFDDIDHLHRTVNHPRAREKLLNLAEAKGIVGSYLFGAGEGAFAARVPLDTLDAMKGKKIRVLASKLEIELMKVMGMAGIPMAYSEVLPAIQRQVIDGARSAILVMGPSKFYSVAKHITLTHGGFIPTGLWFSKQWLNKLPADLRKSLFDLGPDAGDEGLRISKGLNTLWEKKWVEEGGTVHRLSTSDRKEFMRRAKPIGDRILGNDPKTRDMWLLIKSVAEETRQG